MRINHNIPALNAHRMLNRNSNVSATVLERLSSGKRINRAADDAAGMAISEKMKAQVRGLAKAAQNTLDGISLIQTAEGAMNEVHSMLQRMRELAVQSSNGTTTDEDRKAIQAEINQLTSEINRIANGTEFNTRNVLRGNEGPDSNTIVHRMSTGESAQLALSIDNLRFANIDTKDTLSILIDGEEKVVNLNKVINSDSGDKKGALLDIINKALGDSAKAIFRNNGDLEITTTSIGGTSEIEMQGSVFGPGKLINGTKKKNGTAESDTGNAKGTFYFEDVPEAGSRIIIGNEIIEFFDSSKESYAGTNRAIDVNNKDEKEIVEEIAELKIDRVTLEKDTIASGVKERLIVKATDPGFAGHLIYLEGTLEDFNTNLQVGPNQGQGFRLQIGDIRAHKLNISSDSLDGNPGIKGAAFTKEHPNVTDGLSSNMIEYALDVSTEETATAAITVYNNAIVEVAQMRGALGAIQNRLEYTAANLENTQENLTAALSRIEDTDMALEMSEFTKYNILIQAGTAMLAQANQRPQTVLQLLGG